MEIDRRENFRLSEWAPESGTPNTHLIIKAYSKHAHCSILLQILQQKYGSPELESPLVEPWLRDYKDNKFFLIDALLYHREKHTSSLTVIDRDHISLILKECHDLPCMGHMREERVASTAWWSQWEQEFSEYINTSERFRKAN
ncbi:hypothetical protein O181_022048 [Austropuccinia psidii MF-1]|uniref:Uncharacterized protein n=1 Tax=Austropuccinia psidii MF-1 TaxID=1389203 RepID=A0A9Q3GVZ4_9BASI|nr:hypothetical protein [Austropuccinia psidii MF-1]